MGSKNYKVFVVGSSIGYARWIEGSLVRSMQDADVVLFTGGEDIAPHLYGEPNERPSHVYIHNGNNMSNRDAFEVDAYREAISLDKPMWGTCRGAQLLCAMAGGKLVQDMNHWGSHKLHFYDEEFTCQSNSLHHQLQYPYPIPKDQYKILAHTLGLSGVYSGTNSKQMTMPEVTEGGIIKEPEFVYYSKIRGLGIQGHPEMMDGDSEMVKVCHAFLNLMIERKLDDVLKLHIPVKEVISRAWDFSFTKDEKQMLEQLSPKVNRVKEAV